MSSATRTTSKGGKSSKGDTNKSHKHDKSDTGKGSGDNKQHTGNENARSKNDDPGIKEKVKQVMEMTRRSEEEVCLALHECDNDTERAINMLYDENTIEGEWETSSKKKKNRQTSTSKTETEEAVPVDEWNETPTQTVDKEKPRNKSGPPRLHGRHNDSRGWRGRENKENERNLEEGGQHDRNKERRGRPGGGRGAGGGRGRGGGRAGSRYPPRNNRNNFSNPRSTIDTWDNATTWESTTITNSTHNTNFAENWDDFPPADDWSTEEYTGSLADTKVFTPSMAMPSQGDASGDPKATAAAPNVPMENIPSQIVGTLNPAQTQYLNQLTQQSSENMKTAQYGSAHPSQPYANATSQPYNAGQTFVNSSSAGTQQYNNSTQQYGTPPTVNTYNNSSYGMVNSSYGNATENSTASQHQPVRTKTQRARVPPPSKIPSSAVEMPGDLNSSIGYLDVQFGAMDFMSDSSSFDGVTPDTKFTPSTDGSLVNSNQTPNSNLDLNQAGQNTSLDAYSTSKANTQSSISSALSQSLASTDAIPPTTEHLPGTYNAASRSSTAAANATQTVAPSGLDLNKQPDTHSYVQSSSYNSYQPKTSTYQSQSYSSSNYSATQTTSNSYVSNSTPSSYNTPNAGNTYQNSYSVSSYQANSSTPAFPTITQGNSYPPSNQYHQSNQSVYGGNSAGLNSNSNYGSTSSGSQYSSYNASSNKLVKDTSYDSSTTSVSSTTTTTSSVNASTLPQTATTGTKSTTTLAKNASNVMSNIPPAGVAPVMSTPYIMGQVPYFAQQPIYSFEDMQLLQQRIPHMPAGYYDMGYQTTTTLATVRDASLGSVAYSISDGRFTRGDNNTSPVPSTLSQQTSTLTQGHQGQPMLAAQTGAAPYFYAATPYNTMQPFQFGAVYPQLPTVTNAHGSSNSQYPKPATYGSGYGSGYDPLTQSQDYSKGGYVGNAQGQNKGSGANATSGGSSGNDLTAMYGKSHSALGKVNSYDKQGFHSGTPPPFTGALHGNQSTGLAPSGTSYGTQMFIPTMPPHQQHHSAPLMHQPLHQMEVRHQGRRMDSGNTSGQRSQASSQAKSGAKQGYPTSYWNQA